MRKEEFKEKRINYNLEHWRGGAKKLTQAKNKERFVFWIFLKERFKYNGVDDGMLSPGRFKIHNTVA